MVSKRWSSANFLILCCAFECSAGLLQRAERWRDSVESWKWEISTCITCRQKPHQNVRCTEQIFQLRQGCFRLGHTATRRRGYRGSYCTRGHYLSKELDYRYGRPQRKFPLNYANKNAVSSSHRGRMGSLNSRGGWTILFFNKLQNSRHDHCPRFTHQVLIWSWEF